MRLLLKTIFGNRISSAWLSAEESRTDNLNKAIAFALLLHLLVISLLPELPTFDFPLFSRDSALNVFLEKKGDTDSFRQTLNRPLPEPNADQNFIEQTVAAASQERGDESFVSEEMPQIESNYTGSGEDEPAGSDPSALVRPKIITAWSAIRNFTDLEASRYAERNPDEVKRFGRTFNSFRSYQRRSSTVSYRNQYGDIYVRAESSSGDICFKQQRETTSGEFVTRTVYFFRCGRKPLGLDLSPKG